jgi:hypothetical protein
MENFMFNYATQPLSIGKVLDNGIRLCVTSFPAIILFAFLAAVIMTLPGFFAPPPPQPGETIDAGQLLTQSLLPYMLSMLVGFVFMTAMIVRINATAESREIEMGMALSIGVKKLLPVFIGMILYMIAIMAGMVVLVIPGIILMLSLAFYQMLIVLDDNRTFEALRTSHRLVWGNWWRTATVFMVPAVFYIVIYIILGVILGMFIPFTEVANGQGIGTLELAFGIMMIAVSTITMPLFYSIALTQLNDLKLRKQGLDLEERISA